MSRNNINGLLVQLVQCSSKLYKSFNLAESLEVQTQKSKIMGILNRIDFKQLHLDSKQGQITQGVGICSIYEKLPLRISMYYIPAGQTMKLHDHPGMEVISYLFKGRMEARLFTQVKDDLYRKRTINLQKGSVSFIDGYKGNQQNLHQFYALQPSYFLDIIFPDYDESRPCRFFQEVEEIDANTYRLKQILNYDVPFTILNQ